MGKPVYADIPKYKKIDRDLRQIILKQQNVIIDMDVAKANLHERECLESAMNECDEALKHVRQALHELYKAFD